MSSLGASRRCAGEQEDDVASCRPSLFESGDGLAGEACALRELCFGQVLPFPALLEVRN